MQFLFSSHPLLNCVMASLILRWQALWIYVGLLCAQGICPTGYSTWVIRTVDKDNRYCTFLEEKHILNWKFELGKINETLGNKSLLITGLIFPTINSNLHRYICQDWKKNGHILSYLREISLCVQSRSIRQKGLDEQASYGRVLLRRTSFLCNSLHSTSGVGRLF